MLQKTYSGARSAGIRQTLFCRCMCFEHIVLRSFSVRFCVICLFDRSVFVNSYLCHQIIKKLN